MCLLLKELLYLEVTFLPADAKIFYFKLDKENSVTSMGKTDVEETSKKQYKCFKYKYY